ncbi:MAG: HEAT repeat domain-containing protein [Desulfosalsimonas sp.]
MLRLVFPAAVLAGGLAMSQALFTIIVHASNLKLYAELAALKSAGYLVVPGDNVISRLDSVSTAFCGAVFFTVTTGAGLTVAGFAAGWLKRRIFPESLSFTILAACLWVGAVAACNLKGLNLHVTAVFLLVPLAVYSATLQWLPENQRGLWPAKAVHLVVVGAAAAGWLLSLQPEVFLDIRDRMLLSNRAGQYVNDFYYKYTLYPAEAIKPQSARLINACRTEIRLDRQISEKVASALVENDWLPVSNAAVSLITLKSGPDGELVFREGGKTVFKTDVETFLSWPRKILDSVSQNSDNAGFLRSFTFVSLITAFPLGLYIFLHCGLCILLSMVRSVKWRSISASIICLGVAGAVLVQFYPQGGGCPQNNTLKACLESRDPHKQRDALKTAANRKIPPDTVGMSPELAASPHVPVRYWLAASLEHSQIPAAGKILMELTGDPPPNVACMAYSVMGKTGSSKSADFIKSRIGKIKHWYVQQYAYNAMRNLGWKQEPPDTEGNLLR